MGTEAEAVHDSDAVTDVPDASGTSDLRADMEAAFKQFDTEDEGVRAAESDSWLDKPDAVPDASDSVRDGTTPGLDDLKEKAKGTVSDTVPDASDAVPDKTSETPNDADKASETSETRAPVGWKGEAAEAWATIPKAARDHVLAREREIAVTLQNTATARRVAKDFSDIMGKYRGSLQQMGYQSPLDAVDGIMSAAMQLRSGNAQQRAQAAAQVIKDFGIDIAELDSALVNSGATSTPAPNADFEALLDQRLAPMTQFMNQLEVMQHQQAENAKIASSQEVAQFVQDHEFATEVRLEMADILDLAAQRGEAMTLEQAYERACMFKPEIAEKMRAQQAAAQQAAAQQSRQVKENAASSVRGTPGGMPGKKAPETLSDALNAAWDFHMHGT